MVTSPCVVSVADLLLWLPPTDAEDFLLYGVGLMYAALRCNGHPPDAAQNVALDFGRRVLVRLLAIQAPGKTLH